MTVRASGAARAAFVLACVLALTLSSALAQDRDSAHATIEVSGHGGGRTEADVTPLLRRLRTMLARCAEQGRDAAGNEVRVQLTVAESGRATIAPVGDSAAVSYQTCVLGALAHVRFPAGEDGTVELRIGWHEPRSYGTATLGGFHSRSSSLPEHARSERPLAGYPDEQVSSVAQQHDAEVRHCFASELAHRPDVSGTLRVRFTIGLDGTVSGAEIETDDLHAPAVSECLLTRLATWTFPPPTTGAPATVSHAFVLR